MVGLVFTFEGECVQASAAISRALHAACLSEHIAFETLRETCGEAARVAVLFSDLRQLDGFTMRLSTALPPEIAITGLEALRNDRAATAPSGAMTSGTMPARASTCSGICLAAQTHA